MARELAQQAKEFAALAEGSGWFLEHRWRFTIMCVIPPVPSDQMPSSDSGHKTQTHITHKCKEANTYTHTYKMK